MWLTVIFYSMIQLTKEIALQEIKATDQQTLLDLMHEIYHPVYKHLWEDEGEWYVNSTFSLETLEIELAEEKAPYYFVVFNSIKCGIIRIQHAKSFANLPELKVTKLHRIYILPEYHGKNIGQVLMDWVINESIKYKSKILWLESMDTQKQALTFYAKNGFSVYEDFKLEFPKMHLHLRGMHRMIKQLL